MCEGTMRWRDGDAHLAEVNSSPRDNATCACPGVVANRSEAVAQLQSTFRIEQSTVHDQIRELRRYHCADEAHLHCPNGHR